MLGKLYESLNHGYDAGAYKLNPCDYGAHRNLHLLRAALAFLSTDCRCCSGFRVLAVAIAAALFPWVTAAAIAAMMAYGVFKEIRNPQYNYGPDNEGGGS